MCNPDDEAPCVDGDPPAQAAAVRYSIDRAANHDALTAMGRTLLASGALGSHNGLPVTMVISTTLRKTSNSPLFVSTTRWLGK